MLSVGCCFIDVIWQKEVLNVMNQLCATSDYIQQPQKFVYMLLRGSCMNKYRHSVKLLSILWLQSHNISVTLVQIVRYLERAIWTFMFAIQKVCQYAQSVHCSAFPDHGAQVSLVAKSFIHQLHLAWRWNATNRALLPAVWKQGLRYSIRQHIIKTHFGRKITSSILQQIVRAIFQRPSVMEIMKRQFHPWVELGRSSAMLALCFIMWGCKHWDTGLRVVHTSSWWGKC